MYFLSMNRSERSLEYVFLSLTNDDSLRSSGENAKTGKKTAETAPAESRTDSKQTEASQPNSDNVNSEHDDSDRKASEHMASEHKEVSD